MLHIHLFGHLRLFMDGRPQKFSALPKTIPLLAYLLLYRHNHIPRDTLAYTLWPDVPESEARANLRRHLHELRRNLPPTSDDLPWIIAETQKIQWNPLAPAWVDVTEFQQLSRQTEHLAEAAALYTGDLLQNIYEEWLEPERERLRGLYLQTLEQLIERSHQRQDLAQAMNYCQQVVHHDPWRENIIREMMRLRLEGGDRAGALQEYQRFKQRLQDELGVPPMPETRALYQQMVENRIKTPERPRQPEPLAAATPPPAPVRPPQNLPAPLMACVGRETEIATLAHLLSSAQAVRLITLTGPGGIGKTRLALETAHHLWQKHADVFADGVFFVPLANVHDVNLIAPAIAEVTGLKLSSQIPAWEQVKNHLQNKQILLWLDNFEQLLPAAPYLTELLRAAASLRFLVTSQAVLRVYGEQEFAVLPLAVPLPETESSQNNQQQSPAVTLFATVARTTNPSFTLTSENINAVAQICTRLDGLPLAIELAAARSKLFSPQIILTQLNSPLNFLTGRSRDLPMRQRTLREAITWSYNLLTDSEKELFTGLSVFAGSFSLEAALAVTATPGEEGQIYNDLESLVDKNILRPFPRAEENETHFRMLLVIREYAQERLTPDAAARYKQHHLKYYQQFSRNAWEPLYGPEQNLWMRRLTDADDNFRAAAAFAFLPTATTEQVEMGCVMLYNLSQRYWQMKGRISEGRDWVRQALQHQDRISVAHLLRLLNHGGWLAQLQEDYATAVPMHEKALTLARSLNDQTRIIHTLHYLGAAAGRTGDYFRSETMLTECLSLMRQDATTTTLALDSLLNNLGIVQRRLKKFAAAFATFQEGLKLKEARGDKAGIASILSNLGMVYAEQGQYQKARQTLAESLRLRQEVHDRMGINYTLTNLAHLAVFEKKWLRAARLYAAVEAWRQAIAVPVRVEIAAEEQTLIAQVRQHLDETAFAAAWQGGFALSAEEAITYALNTQDNDDAHPTTVSIDSTPILGSPISAWATPAPLSSAPRMVRQELLAVGGMGEVYKAVVADTGQVVVIKRLKPDLLATDPDLLIRFNREAETLRQLNHPNIVKILATVTDPKDPRIIMEYVSGGSLRDLLDRQGALPLSRLLAIGLELADALTRAHHLNIIHRDLKPANILLAEDGSVRLTDFGIAYLANQDQRLTRTGAVMGTAAYLSPEACLGEALDSRSDIWSFGVIMVEMLTGLNPFAGANFTATISSVIYKPLPDLQPLRPDTPPTLFHLIEQMLKKDRIERISSSRQIAAALEQIQTNSARV